MQKIEIIDGENNIYGYIGDVNEDSSFDYLAAFFTSEHVIQIRHWLKKQKISEFVVLRNIYIDESSRGQGTGRLLVSQFITQAKQSPVILLASPDEDNFPLQAWYEKQGFELTGFSCEDGPLMIKR